MIPSSWRRVVWRTWVVLSVLWTVLCVGWGGLQVANRISEQARWDAEHSARSQERLAEIARLKANTYSGVMDPGATAKAREILQISEILWPEPLGRDMAIHLLEVAENNDKRPSVWEACVQFVAIPIVAPQAVLLFSLLLWRWALRPIGKWIAAPLHEGN